MQSKLGRRVILESGPLTNLLIALGLLDQIRIANICRRTHSITVPYFSACLWLPTNPVCDFPNLRIASDDHVIKRIEANIEGSLGYFYGLVRKTNGLPDGFGVFGTSDGWTYCGSVRDGLF